MSVSKIITRTINKGLEAKAGTSVILFHNGQPRTPFYAKEHLKKLWINYGFPSFIASKMVDTYWYGSKQIKNCISTCQNEKSIEEVIADYVPIIERSLTTVIPEFKPINIQSAYLFDNPSIESKIEETIRNGTDTLMLISLYPFELPHLVNPMFKAVDSVINKMTRQIDAFGSDPNNRIAINSPVSFRLMTLKNIGTHSSIIHYWSERLKNKLDDFDSVIFAVSLPESKRNTYIKTINETTKLIMYKLYENYPRAVPWRVAFYSPFYQFWPPLSTLTISNQVKNLRKNGRENTLVVPLDELFSNFDTQVILPEMVEKQEQTELLIPDTYDQSLIHSFVELIKTSLLDKINQERKIPKVKTESTFDEALA